MREQGVKWADVEAAREALNRGRMPILLEQWQALCMIEIPEYKRVEVDSEDHPLRVLFRCITCGRYPPPELLMAMRGAFDEYLEAGGDLTLEEVFFGKPKRRAGNYAKRNAKAERDLRGAMHNLPAPGAADPGQRAEGTPITRKSLARIVKRNPRLQRLTGASASDRRSTGRVSRRKSSAK